MSSGDAWRGSGFSCDYWFDTNSKVVKARVQEGQSPSKASRSEVMQRWPTDTKFVTYCCELHVRVASGRYGSRFVVGKYC
jgi:hypothetical protein